MRILAAPNSMKGSLNAFDFSDRIEEAFIQCSEKYEVRKVPVADGGDFTGEVLKQALNGKEFSTKVKGPFGNEIDAKYAVSGKTAIIEMAGASGIKLIKEEKLNPLKASTFGTGQLIAHAVEKGCNEIFLGIGGSATVDGGTGMMQALGFQLLDENGTALEGNGENLQKIKTIKKPDKSIKATFKIVSDVDNPLLGKNGAAEVFGPQKGATSETIPVLEKGLKNWAELLENECAKQLTELKGAGAAGGMALPLVAFFNAEIVAGADFILSQLDFENHVRWADIVITGEGKIDSQTLNNKAPAAVAKVARRYGKPVFAVGGSVQEEASEAFDGIFSVLNQSMSLEDAMKNSGKMVYDFSFQLAKLILAVTNGK